MVDVAKHIVYWRQGAEEDWAVARELVEGHRTRHGLFFAHLALEKALKAHVCKQTRDLAPRMRNLVRLAEIAGLSPTPEQLEALADLNVFSHAGRYPESLPAPPSGGDADAYLARAAELLQWLIQQL